MLCKRRFRESVSADKDKDKDPFSLSLTLGDGHFIRYIITHQRATLQRLGRVSKKKVSLKFI